MGRDQAQDSGVSLLTGRNIVGGGIILILLIFVFQNRNKTQLSLLFWDITTGLWFLLAVTVILAFVAGILMGRSMGKPSSKKK